MVESVNAIAFGEAMIEHFSNRRSYAGDTINFLKSFQLQGGKAQFFSQFGQDESAEQLLQFLETNQIHTSGSPRKEGKTGSYAITVDNAGERSFSYDRKGSVASQISADQIPDDIFSEAQLFYFSGISLAISDSAKDTGLKLLSMAKKLNIICAYDVNFREKLGSAVAAAQTFLTVLGDLDYCFLSSDDVPVVSAAINFSGKNLLMALVDKHPQCEFVIKQGADGAITFDKNKNEIIHMAPAANINAIDTSGAGDVFNGVYLYHRLTGQSPLDSIEKAVAVASKHVQAQGAFPAKP